MLCDGYHTKDPTKLKPRLKVDALVNKVRIRYPKKRTSGINFYSRRADEKEYKFLKYDANPPAFDERPNIVIGQPETRYYKACYILNEAEVGEFSDENKVVVE